MGGMEWRGGSRRSEVISKRCTQGGETNGASGLRERTVREVVGAAEKLRLRESPCTVIPAEASTGIILNLAFRLLSCLPQSPNWTLFSKGKRV